MGTITVTLTTTSPSQTLTKTVTDTDANIVLVLTALQDYYASVSPAAAALAFIDDLIAKLVTITTNYQRASAAITPINPK